MFQGPKKKKLKRCMDECKLDQKNLGLVNVVYNCKIRRIEAVGLRGCWFTERERQKKIILSACYYFCCTEHYLCDKLKLKKRGISQGFRRKTPPGKTQSSASPSQTVLTCSAAVNLPHMQLLSACEWLPERCSPVSWPEATPSANVPGEDLQRLSKS